MMNFEMGKNKRRIEFRGTPLTSGIAVGVSFRFKQIDLAPLSVNRFPITDYSYELKRLQHSIDKSREQLFMIYKTSVEEGKKDVAGIFLSHLNLIDDSAFVQTIRDAIEIEMLNVEHLLALKINEIESTFLTIKNETLRTRLSDIKDVYYRLLRNLLNIEHVRVASFLQHDEKPILLAEQLLPSDIALLEFRKIKGVVIEELSSVSHVAIITRSLGIPTVMNIPGITSLVQSDDIIILDAFTGNIIVNPTRSEIAMYMRKQANHLRKKPITRTHKKCMTKDGVRVEVNTNANFPDEIENAIANGADGIGLLRTEYFYLGKTVLPLVDEEVAYYEKILKAANNKPVTIRLLDIGADKSLPYLQVECENNPQLGVRGIRFLLENPIVFYNHLTSILKAINGRPVKILIPFVSIESEIDKVKYLISEIAQSLQIDCSTIRIGIMVEIPAVLWSLQSIIKKVDFLSVGTNDLTQFVFAANREDSRMDVYREKSFPVMLKILEYIVSIARSNKKEVDVCGESASDPRLIPLMIGVGIRNVSVQLTALEQIRKTVESKTLEEDIEMAREYLKQFEVYKAFE
jgi:phosphotransferase system enzyme I (PtsI)